MARCATKGFRIALRQRPTGYWRCLSEHSWHLCLVQSFNIVFFGEPELSISCSAHVAIYAPNPTIMQASARRLADRLRWHRGAATTGPSSRSLSNGRRWKLHGNTHENQIPATLNPKSMKEDCACNPKLLIPQQTPLRLTGKHRYARSYKEGPYITSKVAKDKQRFQTLAEEV